MRCFPDSTNADRRGFTGSERDVIEAFEEIFSSAAGKIVVTAFSTSVYRLQLISDLANQFGRKVAFVGRGMQQTSQIADRLGHLRLPGGLQIRESEVRKTTRHRTSFAFTRLPGGAAGGCLPRIAIDDHRHVRLAQSDVVVFSARAIPGNEKAIARVMNHIARRGADVVSDSDRHVHVSGHGSEQELQLVLSLVKPRTSCRYMVSTGNSLGTRMAGLVCPGTKVLMAEDGDVLRFDGTGASVADRVPAGRILIDGTRTGEIADEVLRDRRHLAGDGLVVLVVAINGQTGALEQTPEVITRGLAVDAKHEAVLRRRRSSWRGPLKARRPRSGPIPDCSRNVSEWVAAAVRKRAGRRPLVLPVVMEV